MSLLGIAAIATAVIAGVSSIAKNVSAAKNAQKTNQTNIDINAATNANNLRLAREQNEWNLAQWNRENNYNLPVNQVGRYRQAGINPYMAMNQITNGNSSTGLTSANLANQQSTTVQNPGSTSTLGNVLGGVADGMGSYLNLTNVVNQIENTAANTRYVESRTAGQNIDNHWSGILKHDEHVGREQDIRIKGYGEPHLRKLGDYMASDWYIDSLKRGQNASVTEAEESAKLAGQRVYSEQLQQTYMSLQIDGLSKENQLILPRFAMSMADTAARIQKTYSDIKRNEVLNATDQMNAVSNRINAKANQQNAATNYMVGKSTVRLNEETRKLVGKQVITEVAKAKGLQLNNQQVETIWNANKKLIPEMVELQSKEMKARANVADIKGSKANIVADIVINDMRQVGAFAKDITSAYATLKSGKDVNSVVDGVAESLFGDVDTSSSPPASATQGIPFN